jgi:outer membrane protein assembly factor BamB
MRRLGAGLAILLAALPVLAQFDRAHTFTDPQPPAAEPLRRLNLQMAWRAYIPMDGRRDGFVVVRHTGKHLLVQTHSGLVTQLDAETGQVQWRNRVGEPYRTTLPLTFNSHAVFVTNNGFFYAVDRADGSIQWQMPTPGGVSAPVAVDDDQVYVPLSINRIRAYRLPNMEAEKAFRQAQAGPDAKKGLASYASKGEDRPRVEQSGQAARMGPQPVRVWAAPVNMRLDLQPLVSSEVVLLPGTSGQVVAFPRYAPPEGGGQNPLYSFKTDGDLLTQPGRYEEIAYIASKDYNLYALNMITGRILWRYTAGSPIYRRPIITTLDDAYVTGEKSGLARLDRNTGETMWRIPRGNQVLHSQPDVDQLVAVNPKFVYAADRSGRLVVLDRERGTLLSTWDTRDFPFLVVNDWTDRLYLAAHNGLLVCLHDREYRAPFFHREVESSLIRRLARPASFPPFVNKPVKDILRTLEIDFRLKAQISEQAFKDAGKESIANRAITTPRFEAPTLREGLQRILNECEATFEPVDETILILPGKPKPPPDKQPDKDAPPKDKGM